MNIQQLEYIAALDKFRHFAKAADYCNVSQPTLSTMILKLEEELGAKLFDRSRQPIEPTSIGALVVSQAKQILYDLNSITRIIEEEQQSLTGRLNIAVLPTIAPYLLPRVFPIWKKELAGLEIHVSEMQTSRCLASLLSGEIDMAIIASKAETEGLEDDLLYYEEFLGYVSRCEPLFEQDVIRTTEVDAHRLWLLDEGHCFRDQLVRFCQMKGLHERQTAYSGGSMEAFMRLVESGQGITFIPQLTVEQLSPSQKELVRPFGMPRPVREVRFAVRQDYSRRKLREQLIGLLRSAVPSDMHKLQTGQHLA